VLAAFTLLWTSAARDAPVVHHERPNYRAVLRSGWDMWQLALFYFVTFGGFVAMAIFLPKLLKDWFDYSLTDAGLRAAGFTLVATAARPVGGWFSDRIGGPRVLAIAFFGVGVDAIGLSWQATDPKILPVTIFCLTMAGFLGLGNGAVFKLVPQMFPRSTGAVTCAAAAALGSACRWACRCGCGSGSVAFVVDPVDEPVPREVRVQLDVVQTADEVVGHHRRQTRDRTREHAVLEKTQPSVSFSDQD
jgi:nitrate/nitrite transporter NarK